MNDDLLKISLNQGKRFNTYQSQITKHSGNNYKKEGFVSLQDQEQLVRPSSEGYIPVLKNIQDTTTLNNKANQRDLEELTKLKATYDKLKEKYTEIQEKIGKSSLESINRVSPSNPYLGKNVLFSNGTIAYVTKQGIIKPFLDEDTLNSVAGINGCPPKKYVKLDIPWKSEYIEGAKIPTIPSLIVGSKMKKGESCGNEGSNVYASKMLNNPTSKYIGCYNNNNELLNTSAMNSSDKYFGENAYVSFNECQEYAVENGYKYFGLQDVQSNGMSKCLVSNDIAKTKEYGDASIQLSAVPIWSTNTFGSGATNCYISVEGKIVVSDASGKIVWQSPNAPADCLIGGKINRDSLTVTYGGNCNSKKNSVVTGNVTSKVKNMLEPNNPQGELMISISNSLFGDPAPGCKKNWDTSYQCGNVWKNTHVNYAEGQNFLFDCKEQVNNCTFFLTLQSDGNVSLCRGSEPSDKKGVIWSTKTNGKQKVVNPNWIATKGKFGRSYLKLNEALGAGEWIGSDNGSLVLIMQSDGNLVLYTSESKAGCNVFKTKTYGKKNINAVYEVSGVGNRTTLGKIGYINSESNIREYPDSMIGFINDYQIYENTDSSGNNTQILLATDQKGCQTECNNNPECAAYVYQGSSQTCWLKNKSAFPKGEKQQNSSVVLGVRQPGLKGSTTCSNKIVNIDTVQYDNYLKGQIMTDSTQCNAPIISHSDQIEFDNVKSKLITIGNDIVTKLEQLYNQDKDIFNKLNTNAEQFKKDLDSYKLTNMKITKEINLQDNIIEGMQNLNMNDLNGMLSDPDLRVLQENYSYIMWSILAVGLLTITVNTMKK